MSTATSRHIETEPTTPGPRAAIRLIKKAIQHGTPIGIQGAPGVGKTAVVSAACDELNAAGISVKLHVMHPATMEAIDARGALWMNQTEGEAEFFPIGEIQRDMFSNTFEGTVVVFIDDLGQGAPSIQKALMQLLHGRTLNGRRVADNVTFLMATNRKKDKAGVTGILDPVAGRFATIVNLIPDPEQWANDYAKQAGINMDVIRFVEHHQMEALFVPEPNQDMRKSRNPRTIEQLSQLVDWQLPEADERAVYAGCIGKEGADLFMSFMNIKRHLPSFDEIVAEPTTTTVPDGNPGAMFCLTGMLCVLATRENMAAVIQYVSRFRDREFQVLTMEDMCKVNPEAVECPAFLKWRLEMRKETTA
jgi:MoxR-like ATPase